MEPVVNFRYSRRAPPLAHQLSTTHRQLIIQFLKATQTKLHFFALRNEVELSAPGFRNVLQPTRPAASRPIQ